MTCNPPSFHLSGAGTLPGATSSPSPALFHSHHPKQQRVTGGGQLRPARGRFRAAPAALSRGRS
jgi:hypothetical protein